MEVNKKEGVIIFRECDDSFINTIIFNSFKYDNIVIDNTDIYVYIHELNINSIISFYSIIPDGEYRRE